MTDENGICPIKELGAINVKLWQKNTFIRILRRHRSGPPGVDVGRLPSITNNHHQATGNAKDLQTPGLRRHGNKRYVVVNFVR